MEHLGWKWKRHKMCRWNFWYD